jgi:NADH:ubiquinone reductase (non-electrogenic)
MADRLAMYANHFNTSGSTADMPSKPTIAIVGSGWAGFTLAQTISVTKYNVAVISPTRTIQYTPLLASAAAGMFDFRLAEEPIRRRNKLPGLSFYKATVEDIDFTNKTIDCTPALGDDAEEGNLNNPQPFTLKYDKIVIAPGCENQTFGTPGALEHAMFLRTTRDARRIQQRILDVLDAASIPGLTETQQRDLLRILVVGGGAIGIEATAELWDLWHHDMRHLYPHLNGKLSIEIHDVAPALLGTFDKRLGEYAAQKLEGRGIEIRTSSHIEKVDVGAIWTKERGETRYGMLIWATGNGTNPLVEKLNVKKAGKLQRIVTDRRLRVYDEKDQLLEGVYAMGDSADIEGYTLPTLAEVAVQKAEYLAKELNQSDEPVKTFEYTQRANIAYLGQHDGVIGGKEEWTGQSAWLAWRSGSIYHWPRSWRRTLMIGISWMFNKIGGRDIARKW